MTTDRGEFSPEQIIFCHAPRGEAHWYSFDLGSRGRRNDAVLWLWRNGVEASGDACFLVVERRAE